MPRDLSYTDTALADLNAIASWLTQPRSGAAARRRLTEIWAAIERLRQHPCLYPAGEHQGIREVPCNGGYRALYRVVPDTGRDDSAGDVRVLRIYGPGQNRRDLLSGVR